jgi:integrase
VAGEAGLRVGELRGLRWEDVSMQVASVTLGEIGDACAPTGTRAGRAIQDVAGMLDRVRLRWLRNGDPVALRRALVAIVKLASVMPAECP